MDEILPQRLNRARLQRLAERYSTDAAVLLGPGCWSSAYYLAGYAVECALKACIAKQFKEHDFPDLKTVKGAHTHKLEDLLKLAGLKEALALESGTALQDHWRIVTEWNETARYEDWSEASAREIDNAVRNKEHGVLTWLKAHW